MYYSNYYFQKLKIQDFVVVLFSVYSYSFTEQHNLCKSWNWLSARLPVLQPDSRCRLDRHVPFRTSSIKSRLVTCFPLSFGSAVCVILSLYWFCVCLLQAGILSYASSYPSVPRAQQVQHMLVKLLNHQMPSTGDHVAKPGHQRPPGGSSPTVQHTKEP